MSLHDTHTQPELEGREEEARVPLTVHYPSGHGVAGEGEAGSHKEAVTWVHLESPAQQDGQRDAGGQQQIPSTHSHLPHLWKGDIGISTSELQIT